MRTLGIAPLKANGSQTKYGLGLAVHQYASRAKVAISFPPLNFLNYLTLCSRLAVTASGGSTSSCNGKTYTNLPIFQGVPDAGTGALGVSSDVWVQSPPGSSPEFGGFPSTRVQALAFGSIPVSATVHVSQVTRAGLVQPLHLTWVIFFSVPHGYDVDGWGRAPSFTPDSTSLNLPASASGLVDVTLSDVSIDGQPVDVGSDCAARSSRIDLGSVGGFLATSATPRRGTPSAFNPFTSPSYLDGNVAIAPFDGCHAHGEDLSPLLTSFISGPTNPVDATVSTSLMTWCSGGVGQVDCDTTPALATRRASASPPAVATQSLDPAQRAGLRSLLRGSQQTSS